MKQLCSVPTVRIQFANCLQKIVSKSSGSSHKMSKRYFCEYCERSFIDDLDARKKHLQGTLHTRTKKFHYRQFRDLKTLLEEESSKTECRRFLQTRQCQFGEHCNFTHYSHAQLSEIKKQVEDEELKKKLHDLPSVESWLKERNKRNNPNEGSSIQPHYPHSSPDLPVSLQPINFNETANIEISEWG